MNRRNSPFNVMAWVGGCIPWIILATHGLAQSPVGLPANVQPLTIEGDLASLMVDGADRFLMRQLEESTGKRESRFHRDFSSDDAYWNSLAPNRRRLTEILGLADERTSCDELSLQATTHRDSLVATLGDIEIHRVTWPAVGGIEAEGLLLRPAAQPTALVVAIPDADQTPEQICGVAPGLPPESQFARQLAARGCLVVVPALISRQTGALPGFRSHDLTHREFLYRAAFELGRHLIGYELAKLQNAVDWLSLPRDEQSALKIGVCGYGEGGMLALYLAALDRRVDAVVVSGYFGNRNDLWRQPIDRNVFGLLEQFGDAELATMVAPRRLLVEAAAHPQFDYPPGKRSAPATITTPAESEVREEVRRAREILAQWPRASEAITFHPPSVAESAIGPDVIHAFLAALDVPSLDDPGEAPLQVLQPLTDEEARQRMHRMVRQMDRHSQEVLRESPSVRQQFMGRLETSSPEAYAASSAKYREMFRKDVIGDYEMPLSDPNPRARLMRQTDKVAYYEVVLDVMPDIFAYGVLCIPRDLQPQERRPVVVCQHGLEGRPQDVIGEQGFAAYQAFATRLAEQGYITFAPQNPYIFGDRFRVLQRKSYPLKKTLFSIIAPQHQQIVDWLQSLPFVDPDRVAFYGLSYGGKTAMRAPALVTDYCLSICSADFNDWVDKNASTRNPRSYVWTGEYEIFEWNLGSTFNYAEMAALIAPRPFMVERGHFDGVADDWTVGWEFAKVRHLYQARLKLGDRCEIEWFDGPHQIHGVGTFEFLKRHLAK